jgi:hypothetical protein
MLDVVGVQTPGGATTGNHTAAVTVLERAAQPAADRSSRTSRPDDLAVALEPDFAGGITEQIAALVVGQQRAQMQ